MDISTMKTITIDAQIAAKGDKGEKGDQGIQGEKGKKEIQERREYKEKAFTKPLKKTDLQARK